MPLHQLVYNALLASACVYAAGRGGAPERIVAVLFFTATALSHLLQSNLGMPFRSVEWEIAVIDLSLLACLVWLALVSARFWPMTMAALHGASMVAHAAAPLAVHGSDFAYAQTEVAPSFATTTLLIWAIWRHGRRLRRYGIDPAWIKDLPASYLSGEIGHER